MISLEDIWIYVVLFAVCAATGLGVPLPEDVTVLATGTQIASGLVWWPIAIPVVILGFLTRDLIAWTLGRFVGDWLLRRPLVRRWFGPKLDRAREMIARRGPMAVLVARFTIGMRVALFLMTGAMRVPLPRFIAWDLLGLIITIPAGLTLGYVFGVPLTNAVRELPIGTLVSGAVLLLFAVAGGWWALRVHLAKRRATNEA